MYSEGSKKKLVPATMAASAKTLTPERSDPSEDWTIVLPRRGKKNRTVNKFVIPKRQKEVQLWAPIDLETDPEREAKLKQKMEICIQKFESSEFYRNLLSQIRNPDMLDKFSKVLGSEEKMQMVIYGIGSIESFEPPRLQLSLAILLKRSFDWIGGIELFDPIISLTESKVLASLGCSVLSVNEQGRRQALKPTLFFMPHCEAELYDNLLEVNWEVDRLNRLVIFGNSFGAYEQHASLCKSSAVSSSRKRVLAVRSFAEELRVDTFSDDSFRAFHGTSWHFFGPSAEEDLQMIV
ncbi:protein SENSITIVITY TO RED LIGHT REDUCED 1 [Salvia miltiorrhiza]|uniref:protein SENSITIVITY TO RED LIGHT REDUCED 1 n=1 Tax=Salvia miltiorrhiza TaxID=226208 RepID=UPI0025ABB7E4|nr:protein SENSITIVITY TO RED LIGHT REDUCED 1 [Salvia miltiorrhiza]